MFLRLLLIPILLASLSPRPSQAQTSKEEFLATLKKAFSHETEADRVTALTGLYYFEGTDEKTLEMFKNRAIPILARKKNPEIALKPLPADHRSKYVLNGVEYRPNVPHTGLVSLNDGKTTFPFGIHQGRFLLPGLIGKKVADAKDSSLSVLVMGFGSDGPAEFKGTCRFLLSNGETDEREISDNGFGNRTFIMRAQEITSCSIRLLSESGNLRLVLSRDGKDFFSKRVDLTQGQAVEYLPKKSR